VHVIIHKKASASRFRLPEEHLVVISPTKIRLEAHKRGGQYVIERVLVVNGEQHVFLGTRQLGWCAGAVGSGAWDYPFPPGFDT
jgi:hypothetical protein